MFYRIYFNIPRFNGMVKDSDKLLCDKLKRIPSKQMIKLCARLHLKLADVVTQFNCCYAYQVNGQQ